MGHDIEERRVAAAVEAIYDAAAEPGAWPAALARLAEVFSGGFVDIFTRSHDREHFSGLAYGLDRADYEDEFLGHWFKRNVWSRAKPVTVAGEVLSTRQMVDVAELRRSEIFNRYLDPRGLHEGLRLALWVDEREIQDVSILRPWSGGAFGPAEVALGWALLPHLQRAAAVTRRLRRATLRHEVGAVGPAAWGLAAFTFDRGGALSWFNAAAEAVLAAGELLRLRGGALHAATPAATRALDRAVAGAVGRSSPFPAGTAVVLPRRGAALGVSLAVVPLSGAADWSQSRPPAAVAFLRDPSALALPEEDLRRAFGLTPAEIDLARHLLAGRSLRQVSACGSRSVNTLRSHLAHLLAKTGTRRQGDLVRLLVEAATSGLAGPPL